MLVYKKMRVLGIALWLTGCVRMHKDGDGFSEVFRPWHPGTWLCMVLAVLPCALMGEKLTDVVRCSLSDFWKENKDQLQRVTPFTDMSTLKPFKSRYLSHPRGTWA